MKRGLPLKETSPVKMFIFAFMFIISIYFLYTMLKVFQPRIYGDRINALVINVDSIKSHKNNNTYRYFGKIKFKNKEGNGIIEDYGFSSKLKKNDCLQLYYDQKYGFYDSEDQNVYFVLITIPAIILIILSVFFYKYFID
ncbi:hypothetical protein QQY79_21555 [Flavobacterium tructae]|uniref:hypothetical protein n=1 Tax=Flavobacterium TaxID=237 RepID=UPI002224BD61|nr:MULTISPECIES: hypothetical protein [Flavobacterium]MDL2145120.1 hypothetical protein [Flavobacterium tructae]